MSLDRAKRWGILALTAALLVGCATPAASGPQPSATVSSPASAASPDPVTATATPTPTQSPMPTAAPTGTPRPLPTATSPQAEVVLTLADISWTFWDPYERDEVLLRASEEPGIYAAATIDQNHVSLVYDPTQLTQQEAIRAFENASRLEVIATDR